MTLLTTTSSSASSSLLFSSLSRDQEAQWHESIAWNIIYLSLPIFLTLHYIIPAPWGKLLLRNSNGDSTATSRRTSKSQTFTDNVLLRGPRIPARLAWLLFESPNLVWAMVAWRHRRRRDNNHDEEAYSSLQLANYVLFFLFVAHYLQRAILYPWLMSPHSKPMPWVIVLSGWSYCTFNGYLQCRSLLYFQHFPNHWHETVQFHVGLGLFGMGAWINLQSDGILRNLSRASRRQRRLGKQPQRSPPTSSMSASISTRNDSYYQIPTGGWFDYCSTPHYFGEMVQWTGFCIACQYSLASLSFCLFTAANLIPRGVAQHAWYHAHFNGSTNSNQKYPAHRKAVIPFLW